MRYKFRAWDKIAKCMFEVSQIYFDKHNYFIWDKCGNEYRTNYELMQYTGLKDKNDAEGYEGDRCLFPDGIIRTLIQSDGCFGFKGTVSNIVHCDQHTFKTLEIIGNIHEDKELLEVTP